MAIFCDQYLSHIFHWLHLCGQSLFVLESFTTTYCQQFPTHQRHATLSDIYMSDSPERCRKHNT